MTLATFYMGLRLKSPLVPSACQPLTDSIDNIKKMARAPGQAASGPQFTRALETLTTQESLETRAGDTFFTLHYPIINQEKCQGCHGADHRVRAVVRVETSMEPVLAEVRRASLLHPRCGTGFPSG